MAAHERGQLLRLDGSLMESRKTLKACSLEACPAVVQRDCVRWLDEVSTQIPTVVFEAVTEAGAAQKVTIRQGDQVLTQELDGRPLEMDPGFYEFRFELAGRPSKAVSVLLKQGEKNRLVSVDFREPIAPPLAPAPIGPASSPVPAPHPPPRLRPVPTSVYVLGGLGLVGAAGAAFFGVSTRTKESNAYQDCAPRCAERRIDEIKRWAMATDLSIGVATVATISALFLYTYRPSLEGDATSSSNAPGFTQRAARPIGGIGEDRAWLGLEGRF